ncbi:hypothetical protein BDF19DRAFT_419137 [Syncephalis fuscata]|nr:hypothetical protein BDF19DRAFT_419137 [Syncephalis fuscata]
MCEDPFDSFVDMQMIDDTMNSLACTSASQSPTMSISHLPETTNFSLHHQWNHMAASAAPTMSAPGGVTSGSAASELFKYYLQDQLSLMETNPEAAAVNAAAVAEVAAAAATAAAAAAAANRVSLSAAAQQAKNIFDHYPTSTDDPALLTPKTEPESPLQGFSTLPGLMPSETDAWMNQLLKPTTLSAGSAVQPYQVLLNPLKAQEVDHLHEEETRHFTKPTPSTYAGPRRHTRKHSQSNPYPTFSTVSELNTSVYANNNSNNNALNASTNTIGDKSSSSLRSGSTRTMPRRNSKLYDRGSVSHSDEDMEDEDMVNELLSLRNGVVQHGLNTRRDPLPDEDEIRKMTPKERRQLRNKISARNFRLRRKEYIGTLEAEVKEVRNELNDCRTRCNDAEIENRALKKELNSIRDQLEMALAAATAANLPDLNMTTSSTFERTLLAHSTLCTPLSPATSCASTATSSDHIMMSPSASPSTPCCNSFSLLTQKRQIHRNPTSTPLLTRNNSPAPVANSQRLTLNTDDIHQNCSTANGTAVSHVNWNKSRLIVH